MLTCTYAALSGPASCRLRHPLSKDSFLSWLSAPHSSAFCPPPAAASPLPLKPANTTAALELLPSASLLQKHQVPPGDLSHAQNLPPPPPGPGAAHSSASRPSLCSLLSFCRRTTAAGLSTAPPRVPLCLARQYPPCPPATQSGGSLSRAAHARSLAWDSEHFMSLLPRPCPSQAPARLSLQEMHLAK